MFDRYFYIVTLRGKLTNLLYSPKYGIDKITIASNDFPSDIEAFGEIDNLLDDVLSTENSQVKYHFNKKYFPNNDKYESRIETLFSTWKEYSRDEAVNVMAYVTVDLSNEEKLDLDTDMLEFDIPEIKNGLDIKIFVISKKESVIDLMTKDISSMVH